LKGALLSNPHQHGAIYYILQSNRLLTKKSALTLRTTCLIQYMRKVKSEIFSVIVFDSSAEKEERRDSLRMVTNFLYSYYSVTILCVLVSMFVRSCVCAFWYLQKVYNNLSFFFYSLLRACSSFVVVIVNNGLVSRQRQELRYVERSVPRKRDDG